MRADFSERERTYVGKRVRFIRFCGDDPSSMVPGEEGTCTFMDDIGTLGINWDSGRTVGILVEDEIEII